MEPKIVYEDGQILVLDKPAGMVVNRAKSVKSETVQDWLEKNFQFSIFSSPFHRSGVVHRLDKGTSGLLLVAKTQKAFENLQAQFRKREVEKKYLALVHGRVEPKEGEIEAPVGRLFWSRERVGVSPGGRPAKTYYKKVGEYKKNGEELSLLEVKPSTGRTHQIRVHLKYLGHPVVADSFYAGRKTSRKDRAWCPRQFLHASYLAFTHPKTGEKISFSSKLPKELEKALKSLK